MKCVIILLLMIMAVMTLPVFIIIGTIKGIYNGLVAWKEESLGDLESIWYTYS